MNIDPNFRNEFEWVRQLLYQVIIEQETKIMPVLDDAKANLEQLKTDVAALIARPVGGNSDADVQALADGMAALDADLKAALGQ